MPNLWIVGLTFVSVEVLKRLVQQIGHEGFDPLHLQHVKKFNLKHYDSFQTLTKEEDRG